MKKHLVMLVAAAAMVVTASSRAGAALLTMTIPDSGAVWTLSIEDGCTNCVVTLEVNYSAYTPTGNYLAAINWKVSGLDIVDPGGASLTSTTAGSVDDWNPVLLDSQVIAGGCGGGGDQFLCMDYSGSANTGLGMSTSGTYKWVWDVAFVDKFAGGTGTIRAGYSDADGKITPFSPSDYPFDGTPDGTPDGLEEGAVGSPEPGSLLLFGTALAFVATRLRRRATK